MAPEIIATTANGSFRSRSDVMGRTVHPWLESHAVLLLSCRNALRWSWCLYESNSTMSLRAGHAKSALKRPIG